MNETYTLAKMIYDTINNKKVNSVELLNVKELTPLADFFIIAIVNNVRQTKAIADELEDQLAEAGYYPVQKEGYTTANWILMDYGTVIVHLLDEEDAAFYTLDRLWGDAVILEQSRD